MRLTGGRLGFAPTDFGKFLACRRLTSLSREVALGRMAPPPEVRDPRRDALIEAGHEHEEAVRQAYVLEGRAVRTIEGVDGEAQTLAAMRRGVDVIHQGRLSRDAFFGIPDFLERVDLPSRLGAWSYEVVDAKLAKIARADAVLQIATYSWMLAALQGAEAQEMHLSLGGGVRESFRTFDFAAFERTLRRRFEDHCADPGIAPPEPVAFCPLCDWNEDCQRRRREADSLSLVARTARHQREKLERRGIRTLAALARTPLPLEPPLDGMHPMTFERIRRQAAVQLEGRERGRLRHEFVEPHEEHGLLALPEPSPKDLFLDIEGSSAADGTREFLFGVMDRNAEHQSLHAADRDGERRMFERLMDRFEGQGPDFHIYHYGARQPDALKELMRRHATREDAMDRLLRRRVFVDLLQVVRQGIVASVEGYALEDLESLHRFERTQALPEIGRARIRIDAAEDRAILRRVNREDCLSMLGLHRWLEARRAELIAEIGPRPRPEAEGSPEMEAWQAAARAWAEAVGERIEAADPEDEARRLLGRLLDYHRREEKSSWWEYFRLLELDAEGLIDDRAALGGLEFEAVVRREERSVFCRYRFPPQEHGVRVGLYPNDPETRDSPGQVMEIEEGTLVLKRGPWVGRRPHPRALVFHQTIPNPSLRSAVFHIGQKVVEEGGFDEASSRRAAFDLLRRVRPRCGVPGMPLERPGEGPVAAARRLALELHRGVLPVQGPPGSGKTYLGARVVTALLAAGRRVGVTAQSHRVITNLLHAVAQAATEEGLRFRGLQIARKDGCSDPRIEVLPSSRDAEEAGRRVELIGGTAWVWTRPGMRDRVDVLVVDEAGQFPLANALGCAQAARSLVLLGDPRQLDQVTVGIHPEGSDASALGHLLGEEKTLSPDRGLFLSETWRMHPDICRFTSELFYGGRLGVRPGLERQTIRGGPLPGAGLRFIPVEHQGHRRESAEEAGRIKALVDGLLDDATWTDAAGVAHPLTPGDILVVAPYNAQVERLQRTLGGDVRVGTVDKFQGQEAPVVFYSMATSTPSAAPRGMDFLYSLNRLNVATSRARCLATVVASPELFFPECRTPWQMRLANAFCRFREMAQAV